MSAMIQNDEDKEWMYPLLNLRNDLDAPDDRHLRDFRRMNGAVQLYNDRLVPGPYTQSAREQWLRRLLEAQQWIRQNGPEYVRQLELVTLAELHEIRRIWVVDKHELEDRLPPIYREVTGDEFPGSRIDDNLPFGAAEMAILKRICGDDELHYQLTRELIDVERRHRTLARRTGLFPALEKAFRRGYYADAADARERAQVRRDAANTVADIDSVGSA